MNARTLGDVRERFAHRARLVLRFLDPIRRVSVFSADDEADALRRIYVINLDRKSDRWQGIRRELNRFRERGGKKLSSIVRRFSAIDARYLAEETDPSLLDPTFTLADQLAIHPNPLLEINDETRALEIAMTRQEKAIALSHIEVWKLIAEGDAPSALVLEDDVILSSGFAHGLKAAWSELVAPHGVYRFDLLYLAYRDVGIVRPTKATRLHRRVAPGLWEAAGYVLTKEGAQLLLAALPVRGPVDLWLNMMFETLRVYISPRQLIEQRIDEPSTNSYSVLPVLSQVGAITREKPLLATARKLASPVIAFGPANSGLTALAKALSMLGYTCVSSLDTLPLDEFKKLSTGRRSTRFNGYVDIGELDEAVLANIANHNRRALFITTTESLAGSLPIARMLHLPPDTKDMWAELSEFLKIDYPSFTYPVDGDVHQRTMVQIGESEVQAHATDLRFDRSPWILSTSRSWHGIRFNESPVTTPSATLVRWQKDQLIDQRDWRVRTDTFPSNLALFRGENVHEKPGSPAILTLMAEESAVRDFSSGAIASTKSYLYGSFSARLKPSPESGLITGVFLHRNGPRQEIDIEFLGKDPTKMLVNVYFNPGPDGTKLEYGYRGTPTEIDLGFDASKGIHLYEIEWRQHQITWKVDGAAVYRRYVWGPTPIPDQPLEFNINLWHSRSTEFAGRLDPSRLPATVEVHSIEIRSPTASV